MISVEQALEKILSYVDVLGVEEKPILDSLGQVLAEDVYSGINVPPLDNTAMDGYAVRVEDTRGASQQSPRASAPQRETTTRSGGRSVLRLCHLAEWPLGM